MSKLHLQEEPFDGWSPQNKVSDVVEDDMEDEDTEISQSKYETYDDCNVVSSSEENIPLRLCGLCDDKNSVASGFCSECEEDLCSDCIRRHRKMRPVANHTVTEFPRHEDASFMLTDQCKKHPDEKLRFFCQDCQVLVCRDCMLTSHKHHETEDAIDAANNAYQLLTAMLGTIAGSQQDIQILTQALAAYQSQFEQKIEESRENIKLFYETVRKVLESSYHELNEQLNQHTINEYQRIAQLTKLIEESKQDIILLLNDDATVVKSPQTIFKHCEEVRSMLQSLDFKMQQINIGQSEIFITKSRKLTNITENILGRVSFTVLSPGVHYKGVTDIPHSTVIHEVVLRRELAFNIWEMNCDRSSVRGIVELAPGSIWMATPRSLMKVTDSLNKHSTYIPDDIANISSGPDKKLLISFSQNNTVKLYFNGGWSNYITCEKQPSAIATQLLPSGKTVVYVATSVLSFASSKILVYSHDGKTNRLHRLPREIHDVSSTQISSAQSHVQDFESSTSSPPPLKISCMAVESDGGLILGDSTGKRLIMLNSVGKVTGVYCGADSTSGCMPRSICITGPGKVVLADSQRACIELISTKGELLATLLTRDNFQDCGGPTAVAVDTKGRLWVGTSMGHVSAYSFLVAE